MFLSPWAWNMIWRSGWWLQWSAWASNTILWFHTSWEENIIKARNWKNGALFYWSAKFIGSKYSGRLLLQFSSNVPNEIIASTCIFKYLLYCVLSFLFWKKLLRIWREIQNIPSTGALHSHNLDLMQNIITYISSNFCEGIFDVLLFHYKQNEYYEQNV